MDLCHDLHITSAFRRSGSVRAMHSAFSAVAPWMTSWSKECLMLRLWLGGGGGNSGDANRRHHLNQGIADNLCAVATLVAVAALLIAPCPCLRDLRIWPVDSRHPRVLPFSSSSQWSQWSLLLCLGFFLRIYR